MKICERKFQEGTDQVGNWKIDQAKLAGHGSGGGDGLYYFRREMPETDIDI